MSFSSKHLLPPSFYLIKVFKLQQIQWHTRLDRWLKENTTSAGTCRDVSRVTFYILFLKQTQGHIMCHSVFTVWQARLFFKIINLYHSDCNSVQSTCNSVGQEADVERPCQQTIWWRWIRGPKKAASLTYASKLTFCSFYFWTYELWILGCCVDSWGRRSYCIWADLVKHLDRYLELNTDIGN